MSFVSAGDVQGSRFCCDSRQVSRGDIFVALRGIASDGHDFIESAVASGAAGVVVERPNPRIAVPQCIVRNSRQAWAWIAMAQFDFPQKNLTLAGVTGTNGKTTVAWLLRTILQECGHRSGLIGTIQYCDGRSTHPATLTTPDSPDLARLFRQMVTIGTTHCVMEVSSHALVQERCSAFQLATAAITNVTRDHFDYHGTFENYVAAKAMISKLLPPEQPLLLGTDDAGVREVRSVLGDRPVLTFGFQETSDYQVRVTSSAVSGQDVSLRLQGHEIQFRTPLVGRHNALNLLTAAALAEQMGVDPDRIRNGLQKITSIPGRMESIDLGQDFLVLVDYAHTPDGITQVIATARTLSKGRVIIAFGAGGDRDREKRPLMAQAASAADVVVVTSDNPRSESPTAIIDDICKGFSEHEFVHRINDREEGIRTALKQAGSGDVVLITGRGHEATQQIGNRSISFDDRKVTRRVLKEILANKTPQPGNKS
ncbi:MAG: UDP-N-acetylmuramoyl-L-alanyl-D-glutamate--2,6-diaminopimelate ligase [Planctomycetaceae bacterium]|nr:UDP-N-acetylmuramoyl-L-alanyl-D-glutamate--2,6-diaminopimelate ligase [Planctomycetaceae bacterium]